MILRSRGEISALKQSVRINNNPDYNFACSEINLGSHSGLTEAYFDLPQTLFDEIGNDLRDARVEVEIEGQGTAFVGYLSVDTGELSPVADHARMKAFTITKWLEKYHVGQGTNQWEVTFWVRHPETKVLTGWTPALMLYYLFLWLPEEYLEVIRLGDLEALHSYSAVGAPNVTLRLCSYAEAITQLMAYVGDVAFRERFENGLVYLDFYRVNEPKNQVAVMECCEWNSPRRGANVQGMSRSEDGSELTNRVQGFGAYMQHMISCKSMVVELPEQSEMEVGRQLIPMWEGRLEKVALLCPELTKGLSYSCKVRPEFLGLDETVIRVDLDIREIPVGSLMRVESSGKGEEGEEEEDSEDRASDEIMRVVEFDEWGGTGEDTPSPPVVTVERAVLGTTKKALKAGDVLTISIPGIEKVFREYRLPRTLDGLPIMKEGCLEDGDGDAYPQFQAFVYRATKVYRETIGPLRRWIEGVIGNRPSLVDDAKFDVARRTVTFGNPTLTLLRREGKLQADDTTGKKVEYQRTVCGVTVTVENRERPFGFDTGPVHGQSGLEFTTHGLTERWQKNEYEFKALGTGGLTVRGLDWPCYWFVAKERVDPITGEVLETPAEFKNVGLEDRVIVVNDWEKIKNQCEQMLMEYNRRARSGTITIPHYSPGLRVGMGVKLRGLRNWPNDVFVITSVQHELPADHKHKTRITVDNIKPPARQVVRPV